MKNNYITISNACRNLKISEIITIDNAHIITLALVIIFVILSQNAYLVNKRAKYSTNDFYIVEIQL